MLLRTNILSCIYKSLPLVFILKQLNLVYITSKLHTILFNFYFLCASSQMWSFIVGLPSYVSNIPILSVRATCLDQWMFVEFVILLFREE